MQRSFLLMCVTRRKESVSLHVLQTLQIQETVLRHVPNNWLNHVNLFTFESKSWRFILREPRSSVPNVITILLADVKIFHCCSKNFDLKESFMNICTKQHWDLYINICPINLRRCNKFRIRQNKWQRSRTMNVKYSSWHQSDSCWRHF